MKAVLGFVLIRSEYSSVSSESFSCHFHSSYFQRLVPRAYCRVSVYKSCFVCHSLRNSLVLSIHFNLVPYCNWSSLFSYQVFTTLKSEPYSCITTINSIHSRFSPLSLARSLSLSLMILSFFFSLVILLYPVSIVAVDSPDCHTDVSAVVRDYLFQSSLPLYQQLCHVRQARGSQWTGNHTHCVIQVWLERGRQTILCYVGRVYEWTSALVKSAYM